MRGRRVGIGVAAALLTEDKLDHLWIETATANNKVGATDYGCISICKFQQFPPLLLVVDFTLTAK